MEIPTERYQHVNRVEIEVQKNLMHANKTNMLPFSATFFLYRMFIYTWYHSEFTGILEGAWPMYNLKNV